MVYSNSDISKLPTIKQLLQLIKEMKQKVPVRHLMAYDRPIEDEDLFILSRTSAGSYTIKPNITMQPFLYAGHVGEASTMKPSLENVNKEDFHAFQLMNKEFMSVMCSYPLYRLLFLGLRERRFRLINPFGNLLAYGFSTNMIPLSSSLEIAAFFATHKKNGNRWDAIGEENEHEGENVGVLYVMELGVKYPMMTGLNTVGKQAFVRPGNLKLFTYQLKNGEDFNESPFVRGFTFKQCKSESQEIGKLFEGGKRLFPDELIARKADAILKSKRVSKLVYEVYLRQLRMHDYTAIKKEIEKSGIEIVNRSPFSYTNEELWEYYYPYAEEKWEKLFSNVIALHPGLNSILEKLRDVPNLDEYKKYFRP